MALLQRTTRVEPTEEPRNEQRSLPAQTGGEVTAILQKGSTFEGKLAFDGTVHINGNFFGEIRSTDTLVIGEGAKVHGELDVGTLIVNGELDGKIRARHLVEMHAPARVNGTVHTPALVIDRGVIFEGETKMEDLDGASATVPATPKVSNTQPPKASKS